MSLRIALTAAVSCALLAPTARAFDVHRHAAMTTEALSYQFGGHALWLLLKGNTYPDLVACATAGYCESWKLALTAACKHTLGTANRQQAEDLAPDHFDDDRIAEGRDRAMDRLAKARAVLLSVELEGDDIPAGEAAKVAGAIILFGAALHGIQDFYAHSTYLECHDARGVPLDEVDLWDGNEEYPGCVSEVPVWDGKVAQECKALADSESKQLEGLRTGHFFGKPEIGETCHDYVNKDNPSAEQGKRRLGGQKGAPSYYSAVSGQSDADTLVTDAYRDSGLAVAHTQHALESLFSGEALYSGHEMQTPVDLRIDRLKLRATEPGAESDAKRVERIIVLAASDPDVGAQAKFIDDPAFWACLGGEPLGQKIETKIRETLGKL